MENNLTPRSVALTQEDIEAAIKIYCAQKGIDVSNIIFHMEDTHDAGFVLNGATCSYINSGSLAAEYEALQNELRMVDKLRIPAMSYQEVVRNFMLTKIAEINLKVKKLETHLSLDLYGRPVNKS